MPKTVVNIIAVLALFLTSASLLAQTTGPGGASQITTCPLYIPNAFTPNGDNLNEKFLVKHGEDCRLMEYNIKIFDRWGRLVFEHNNSLSPDESWDGTVDGSPVEQGVYMYKVYAKLKNYNKATEAEIVNRQGSLVLIR